VALTIDEEGQARTAEWKVRVAARLIEDLTTRWGLGIADILVDCLTFPISTGQEETRRDAIETIEAIREISRRFPGINFTLGISNISFGLNPAARQVLNSVFLHECQQAGLTSAIVHASKILPMSKIPDEQREVALDMVYDRRREGYDPLGRFIELFEGVDMAAAKATRAEELAGLPLDERLQRRIIDGERNGLEADLEEALRTRPALAIINDTLLAGMKTVGELFGSGQMQLPFVLQSAEVMKTAVAYLEQYMEKADDGGKGRIVLATVKGDVHDIGKNLVDIILTNNGYEVVNIGIKQPITAILDAAEENKADAIGMSGLLVKSTVIMKENLQEMDARGVSQRWPVLLGGAALTRAFVEDDLQGQFAGQVHYARDAFEGLSLMDKVMAAKRGEAPVVDAERERKLAERRERRARHRGAVGDSLPDLDDDSVRSDVAVDAPIPTAPFFGTRVVKGIPLADYSSMLDERALFLGQWGLRASRGGQGPSYEELIETEGRPRMRYWLDRLVSDQVLEAAVVYGYFPCYSEGNTLVVLDENGAAERARFTFPRQRTERRLCIADFFKPRSASGELDVIGLQLVTVGQPVSEYADKLRAANAYRDYFEVHGLSVQLAEALAEYWHHRIRTEFVLPSGETVASFDPPELAGILANDYRGCRYSFGYAACPDLEDRAKIAAILEPERIGVVLSEEFQLDPEQSTDAIVVHHPEASYFNAK
jgi:5-methyltetrahydrofolate--homocysteine methyltransferase